MHSEDVAQTRPQLQHHTWTFLMQAQVSYWEALIADDCARKRSKLA